MIWKKALRERRFLVDFQCMLCRSRLAQSRFRQYRKGRHYYTTSTLNICNNIVSVRHPRSAATCSSGGMLRVCYPVRYILLALDYCARYDYRCMLHVWAPRNRYAEGTCRLCHRYNLRPKTCGFVLACTREAGSRSRCSRARWRREAPWISKTTSEPRHHPL